ncbi:hypothetical protein AHF37_05970 [Paragonimus kellicotti]|nr:hypothetical protein AHF37_05970 [Paragonimus kellicotti]
MSVRQCDNNVSPYYTDLYLQLAPCVSKSGPSCILRNCA